MKTFNRKLSRKNLLWISVLASSFTIHFASAGNTDTHVGHDMSPENPEHMHDHGDNPVLTKVMIDQLESRNHDDNHSRVFDAQAWIGKDLHKLWLKVEVENQGGDAEDTEVQALYSRAIAPYWDLQLGIRSDLKPQPATNWGVIGIQGLAPYFFEIDAAFFLGKDGNTAARLSTEYELLFTQRLILSPEVEFNFYGQNDVEKIKGSGLSDLNAGLRLRYEIYREFAPYIGINWEKRFGETESLAKKNGDTGSETQWVIGLRAWF